MVKRRKKYLSQPSDDLIRVHIHPAVQSSSYCFPPKCEYTSFLPIKHLVVLHLHCEKASYYDYKGIRKVMKRRDKTGSNQSAISTSNRARYEYMSGDMRYLRIPAKTISDRDFFRTAASVIWRVASGTIDDLTF